MLTKSGYELVPQNEETTSEVNPLLNKEKLEEMLRCPVTRFIFYKPVKLLLVNDLESSGAIVEKDVVSKLAKCPVSRKPISGHIPAREITNLVDLYLAAYPDAKKDQYSPPPAIQPPETAAHIDIEAQVPALNPMVGNEVEIISFLEYMTLQVFKSRHTATRGDVMTVALLCELGSIADSLFCLFVGLSILYPHDLDDGKRMKALMRGKMLGSIILPIVILLVAAKHPVEINAPIQSFFGRSLWNYPLSASFILSVVFTVGASVMGQMLLKHDTTMADVPKTSAVALVGASVAHGAVIGLFRCIEGLIEGLERLNCTRLNSYAASIDNYLDQPASETLRVVRDLRN